MPRLSNFMNNLFYLRRRIMSLFINTKINDKLVVLRGPDEPWISRQLTKGRTQQKTFDFSSF